MVEFVLLAVILALYFTRNVLLAVGRTRARACYVNRMSPTRRLWLRVIEAVRVFTGCGALGRLLAVLTVWGVVRVEIGAGAELERPVIWR